MADIANKQRLFCLGSKGLGLREILHRVITYPILTPVIFGYMLTKDSRMLDTFYSIRSIPHGFPMKNSLRLAKYNGNRILFPSREDPSFDDVFLTDVYHPYKPQKKDVVFDIGAHMGFFTVKVGKHVKKLIAFEPDPYNFSFLLLNIEYNALSNVNAFNYALGDRDGYAFLERGYGYGRTRLAETNKGYRVLVRTLDAIVEESRIIPSVIKIDAEGYEMKVLKGAKYTLACYKPRLILACYHYRYQSRDVVKYLIRMGYNCLIYHVSLPLQKFKEAYVYSEPS